MAVLNAYTSTAGPIKGTVLSGNYDPTYSSAAMNQFNAAAKTALPTRQEFDTAAARVQSRVEAQRKANQQTNATQLAGAGRTGSGRQDYLSAMNNAGAASAAATGIADLEGEWWKRQQEGSQILNSIGSGIGSLGTASSTAALGQGKLALDQYLGQQSAGLKQEELKNQFLNDAFQSLILGGNQFAGSPADSAQVNQNYNERLNLLLNSLYGGLGLQSNFTTVGQRPRPPQTTEGVGSPGGTPTTPPATTAPNTDPLNLSPELLAMLAMIKGEK